MKDFIGSKNTFLIKHISEKDLLSIWRDLEFCKLNKNRFMTFYHCPFCFDHDISNKTFTLKDAEIFERLRGKKHLLYNEVYLYSQYYCCGRCEAVLYINHEFIDVSIEDPESKAMHETYKNQLLNSLYAPYPRQTFAYAIKSISKNSLFDFQPRKNISSFTTPNIIYNHIYQKYAITPSVLNRIPKNTL